MSYKEIDIPNHETAVASSFPEPRIIFIFAGNNGYPGEEQEMTMTSFLEACQANVQEGKKVNQFSGKLHERQQTLAKDRTPSGKRYSHTEERQIASGIENDRRILEEKRVRFKYQREELQLQSSWLIKSPGEAPISVAISREGARLVQGEPLSNEEAAWRLFVYRNGTDVWTHPRRELVEEHFNLRRRMAFAGDLEKPNVQKEFDEFRKRNSENIPYDLIPIMRNVANYDYKAPLFVWPKIS